MCISDDPKFVSSLISLNFNHVIQVKSIHEYTTSMLFYQIDLFYNNKYVNKYNNAP